MLDNVSGIEREIDDDDEEEEEEADLAKSSVEKTVTPASQRSSVSKLNQLFTLGELSSSSPDSAKSPVVDISLEDNRNGITLSYCHRPPPD